MSDAMTGVLALAARFDLVAIPVFILMGNIARRSGRSRALYEAAFAMVGGRHGGLALAALLDCGVPSALGGSSIVLA